MTMGQSELNCQGFMGKGTKEISSILNSFSWLHKQTFHNFFCIIDGKSDFYLFI